MSAKGVLDLVQLWPSSSWAQLARAGAAPGTAVVVQHPLQRVHWGWGDEGRPIICDQATISHTNRIVAKHKFRNHLSPWHGYQCSPSATAMLLSAPVIAACVQCLTHKG